MKHLLQISMGLGCILCCILAQNALIAQTPRTQKRESVRLAYELLLSECQKGNCSDRSISSGQEYIELDPDPEPPTDSNNAWGYNTETYRVGNITYFLRFFASHDSSGRHFSIGYSGRQGSPHNDKQVTYAIKNITNASWKAFPVMSVKGQSYSDDDKIITPRLVVKVIINQ
jgi:hypothetical protein